MGFFAVLDFSTTTVTGGPLWTSTQLPSTKGLVSKPLWEQKILTVVHVVLQNLMKQNRLTTINLNMTLITNMHPIEESNRIVMSY
jgi:hypothetical protein